MRNVRVDSVGELRCWKCGSVSFKEKRTMRSKATFGVGALLTKQKLKCRICGEYNDVGKAKPYTGPASTRLGKKYGTITNLVGADSMPTTPAISPHPTVPPPSSTAAQGPPPGWYNDPDGAPVQRWWDGTVWTEHTQ